MSVAITIKAKWSEYGQMANYTKLIVTVDLTNVQALLDVYNMMIQVMIRVTTENPELGEIQTREYPYTYIVEQVGQRTLQFEAVVYGVVKDLEQIKCFATGYLICRK